MSQMMTIAALQIKVLDLTQPMAVLRLTELLQRHPADLICFPELCLQSGVTPQNYEQAIVDQAKDLFAHLAKKQHAYVVLGSVLEKINEYYVNRSYLFSPLGEIIGWYDKKHLDKTDTATRSGGGAPNCFVTPWGKVGLLICRDLLYPQTVQALAAEGAEIIVCSAAWYSMTEEYPKEYVQRFSAQNPPREVDALVSARAIENGVAFIFINQAGEDAQKKFLGRTQVAVPFYGTIARLEHHQEQVLMSVLDLELIRSAKMAYGFV